MFVIKRECGYLYILFVIEREFCQINFDQASLKKYKFISPCAKKNSYIKKNETLVTRIKTNVTYTKKVSGF